MEYQRTTTEHPIRHPELTFFGYVLSHTTEITQVPYLTNQNYQTGSKGPVLLPYYDKLISKYHSSAESELFHSMINYICRLPRDICLQTDSNCSMTLDISLKLADNSSDHCNLKFCFQISVFMRADFVDSGNIPEDNRVLTTFAIRPIVKPCWHGISLT